MTLRRLRSRRSTVIALVASTATITSMGALTGLPASDAAVQPAAHSAAASTSQTKGHTEGSTTRESLPNFDARTASSRTLLKAGVRVQSEQGKAIDSFADKLGPSGVVSVDAATGTPDNVARTDGFLTGPSSASATSIALGYVTANADVFGLDSADLATFSKATVVTDTHGVRHVSWTQSFNGVEVFGNGLRAHVAKDGSLIAVQGAPVHDLAGLAAKAPAASLSATAARSKAVRSTHGTLQLATAKTTGSTTRWSNGDTAQKVWFVTASGLRQAWATYTTANAKASYQQVLDARTGSTLYRHNTVNQDRGDGLVYNNYPGAPKGGKPSTVNVIDRGYLGKNASWLSGKYVYAWADLNDDDVTQESEKTPVPGNAKGAQFALKTFNSVSDLCSKAFPCTWDPETAFSWRANKNQDATQGFILASKYHDYLLGGQIGFTPQMGNFETNGGDPVLLHVLDGANSTGDGFPDGNHIDNANMNTPPDGVPPTMQMYLNHFPGTTSDEDPYLPSSSADSADNIFHEYTHGLSNRLVVDAGGNSTLNSLHAGSMGEAWSDYYAMDYLVTKGMVTDTARNGEVLFDSYLTNHRPITRSESIDCSPTATGRYCTKANGVAGGYTFGDLGNATGGPEVHADSEIWGQTLWDLRTELGHGTTAGIVTEAMSLSPDDPSFLDERDALLIADQTLNGGANKDAIWQVFADRGMGWFASATDGSDASVVEDFHVKPRPGTAKRTITGTVTDDATGEPIEGAYVRLPGHASGVSNYADTTDVDGEYEISGVLAGRYPELVATAPAYDVASKVADLRRGDLVVDFELRHDWAASAGGATVTDHNGADYGEPCGPGNAIDLNYGTGWSTNRGAGTSDDPADTPTPKFFVVKLPEAVDVSAFGVDPSNNCGDAGSASTGPYRIEVSKDGVAYNQVAQGTFTPANRGRVNEIGLSSPSQDVQYVKFWMDDSQVEQLRDPDDLCSEGAAFDGCQYIDLTELEVYGSATGLEDVQLLSFNDFHGHLLANDEPQAPLPAGAECDTPAGATGPTCVGGVEYLASYVDKFRSNQPDSTITAAAGDLIGGSTFMSGLFQDQPSVEAMNELGLDVTSVGNHEFDEGLTELQRMVEGGCQPAPKGCFEDANGDDIPYAGTDFDYLGANVVDKNTGENLPWLPGTSIKTVDGVKVGFIGMTLEATPTLVNPVGVSAVNFEDEVETANAAVPALKAAGAEAIVVLIHEGGLQAAPSPYNGCNGISGAITTIAQDLDPEIDEVISGHTHQPYVCTIDDPAGDPRLVTSAASYGQVLTVSHLKVDPTTGEVDRVRSYANNQLVTRNAVAKDAGETDIINFWQPLATALGNQVVGKVNSDIVGDSSTCRCEETPMADLVADAILYGTEAPENGGAELALMNTGGVRNTFKVDTISGGEQPGEITYAEAYNVAPFNNILVTVDLTGAQIETILEQQYQRVSARGTRPMLSLGVSDGFTYDWVWEGATPAPNTQPTTATTGGHVENMELNGVPMDANTTYRVGTLNFLADGGDLFTGFSAGTNRLGAAEDLPNLVAFLQANQAAGLDPPAGRIDGL